MSTAKAVRRQESACPPYVPEARDLGTEDFTSKPQIDSNKIVLSNDLDISTEQFLQMFWQTGCFRTFSDVKKSDVKKSDSGHNLTGTFESHRKELHKENRDKRGAFFIPNIGGHEDKYITEITSAFMDLDKNPIQPVLDVIERSGLIPHCIVHTSPPRPGATGA
jgi:hypothetical protein